ncbi:hypothetical protein FACS189481_1410 [Clostridia bacterium]|nr:hypothetical protein FACS189481_1410 [Clostridia bacterium]
MENIEVKEVLGDFKLSENVVSTIVALAATEVADVACVSELSSDFKNIWSKDSAQRATKVKVSEGAIMVDLCVKVRLGADLKKTAQEVQRNVKAAVQNMTGFVVPKVNVIITGICADYTSENVEKEDKEVAVYKYEEE